MQTNASATLITTQIAPQTFAFKPRTPRGLRPYRISHKDALAGIFNQSFRGLHGFGLSIEVPWAWVCLQCGKLVTAVAIGDEPSAIYDAIADTVPSALLGGRPPITVYFAKLAYFHDCLYCQAVEADRYLHSWRRLHQLLEPSDPEKELSRCQ